MSIADQLIHTTVRIETQSITGAGSGTGFFVNICELNSSSVPLLVTNKHVISGAVSGQFHLTVKKSGCDEPDIGNHVAVPVADFEQHWVLHPDPDVDLAVFPIAPVLEWLKGKGHDPYYKSYTSDLIADDLFEAQLSAVEDVVMVGYPNGLWDSKHNLPIVRRGITATAPYVNFEGRPQFVIDCACFPGSSGSPVLLLNSGGYVDKQGNTNLGPTRFKLLGILWGGPQFMATGEIKTVPVPTSTQQVSLSRIPINLGYCIKASQLRWFEIHFTEILAAQASAATQVGSA